MEETLFLKRLQEKVQRASKFWQPEHTEFIYRDRLGDFEAVFYGSDIYWKIWGGYEDAERVQIFLAMMEMDLEEAISEEQALIQLRGPAKFITADHRDYLGALMSLGITRERFGDLIVRDDGCDVIVSKSVVPVVLQSDLKVKRVRMKISEGDFSQWEAPKPDLKELNVQVNSLRLDSIIAKGFNLSRAVASELINKELVQVNHKVCAKVAESCLAEDIISVKGYGKLKVGEIEGQTKKGKQKLVIFKYQ